MIPNWGSNPFCKAPVSGLAGSAYFPIGFTLANAFDHWMNVKAYRFTMLGFTFPVPGINDGFGGGLSSGPVGLTKRRVGSMPSPPAGLAASIQQSACTDVLHIRQSGLAVFKVDWSRVVRGSTALSRDLVYPHIAMQFLTEGSLVSTLPIGGGLEFNVPDFADGITDLRFSWFTDSSDIFLDTIVRVTVEERYDQLRLVRAGAVARISGPEETIGNRQHSDFLFNTPLASVRIGARLIEGFTVSADRKTLEFPWPTGLVEREPVVVETSDGDVFWTRMDA